MFGYVCIEVVGCIYYFVREKREGEMGFFILSLGWGD